jgi:hypothetical protein
MARKISAVNAKPVRPLALQPPETAQTEDRRDTRPATATIIPRAIVASIFSSVPRIFDLTKVFATIVTQDFDPGRIFLGDCLGQNLYHRVTQGFSQRFTELHRG